MSTALYIIIKSTHTKKKSNGDFGRSYRHYMYKNKVYKSLDKFLEAIKDVGFKG